MKETDNREELPTGIRAAFDEVFHVAPPSEFEWSEWFKFCDQNKDKEKPSLHAWLEEFRAPKEWVNL